MQTRKLGSSNLAVSALGLGCMRMTFGDAPIGTKQEMITVLHKAVERGITFFDTAEVYPVPMNPETQGRTETFIGGWLEARGNRDKVVLASKVAGGGFADYLRDGRVTLDRANIEAAIERSGLRQRVRCLGKISEEELVELYRRGKLFVMPNIVVPGDMEGFGIVMLEAGACGLPTLAADLEGIRDVVEEGVNGWFAPSEDAGAFIARVESLLDDPDGLREASERTMEYVTSTFRWDSTAERYLDALR